MDNLHHKPIKKFSIDGVIHDESTTARLRTEYTKLLTTEMRLSGYVPRLDINHDFTLDYNYSKQYFEFQLSIYGVYLGKRQAEWIDGVDETRIIYTRTIKYDVSSTAAE